MGVTVLLYFGSVSCEICYAADAAVSLKSCFVVVFIYSYNFHYIVGVAEAQMLETGFNPAPWTPEEQKLLEQGLKTFPATVEDRWENIATALPQRNKKDCMKRYKVCCPVYVPLLWAF